MARHPFKTPGIARTGFEYQDLIGIEVLLRFYRDPELFHWVALEADDPRVGKLDDVVAARKDGAYELLQVKFTPDPAKYLLDWDWLLHKKPKGTSLIKKWADALVAVTSLGPVHSAKLRTNRKPSTDFNASLTSGLVDFDRIETTQKAKLVAELGGEAIARAFFRRFEFSHSEALVDGLEARLMGEIVPSDTDNSGWLVLRDQARRWATRKNTPEPDGRIHHAHLVQIITKKRPQPIPQDFTIPAFYQVPSKQFNDDFIRRITSGPRSVSVLWGTPGRGKSTYLSYLVKSLRESRAPAVRHHYFLALDDSTVDRVSFTEISNSLMDQIGGLYPNAVRGLDHAPNLLRTWLEACGTHFAAQGKRFYVVIDGLDHVWRENRSSTSQMAHLFNYLLPCPENVCLLIGTQKVAPEQLPLKLVQQADESDWIEVPPLDEEAIHSWLAGQYDAGRLLLRDVKRYNGVTELSQVSQAFFAISNGNPLHLIYSFEALVRRGIVVTEDEVALLPSCPDGDIRKYYGSLWTRLSANGRKVLHLVAGSDFHWPADGLRACAGSLDEVDHLLEPRRTGFIPFHGSILAYAREQTDHDGTFRSMLPLVIRWLERDAPEYWQWAWLWIMRARAGDTQDLLNSTTRNWVVESLVKGWPADQIINILDEAERCSFDKNDYVLTGRLRSLKIRMQNGQQHQVNRFNDFEESAVRVTGNWQQILNMADGISTATEDEVVTLLRCLAGVDRDGIGGECYEEFRKRVNLWIGMRHRRGADFPSLAEKFLEAAVEFGRPDLRNLLRFISHFQARDRLYHTFLRHAARTRRFELTLSMYGLLTTDKHAAWRNPTEITLVQIAAAEGIDLALRLAPVTNISPLLSCWYRAKELQPPQLCSLANLSAEAIGTDYEYGPNPKVERFLYDFFFLALDTALQAEGACSPAFPGIDRTNMGWLQEAVDQLWSAAFEIAQAPERIGFESIFVGLANLAPVEMSVRPSDPKWAQYRALRAVVGEIAIDLHALKCGISGPSAVEPGAFETARGSTHWLDEVWIEHELNARRVWIAPAAIKALINELDNEESKHVTQFNDRAERWIDMAQLCVLYGLHGGEKYLTRAASCIIGYGWRKDAWIFDVLAAIQYVHEVDADDVRPWLEALAPVIDQITTFTDGDETNYAPEEFIDIVAKAKPEWLPPFYEHYIAGEEYRLAERTLGAILSQLDFSESASVALANSLLEGGDLYHLEKLNKSGRAGVAALLRKRKQFLGIVASRQEQPKKASRAAAKKSQDDFERRGKPPDITKFAPDKLQALLRRVERPKLGYKHRDESLIRWLKHWDGKGKGLIALNAIDHYFNTHENPHAVDCLLDEAFDVSLRYEGRAKAYKWLVRAHIERHGWNRYWDDSGRVRKRLELAAKHYKGKWENFIHDTSKPARYWEKRRPGIVIGTGWLVEFLLLAKQEPLAVKIVDSMVEQTLEEVRDQPIPSLRWLS